MRQALLSVDDESLAAFGFSAFQEAGLLDIEILSCEGSRGVSRIHVEQPLDDHQLDEIDTIQWWEQVSGDGPAYVYLVEMNVADRLAAMGADGDGIPRAEWAEVHDQGFSFEQAGSQEALSAMMVDLQAAGLDITLHRLQDYRIQNTPLDALTDRQREVIELAYEFGYYDVPRRSSAAEIAAELGVDDSTVAEHLQRAEHNLFRSLLG